MEDVAPVRVIQGQVPLKVAERAGGVGWGGREKEREREGGREEEGREGEGREGETNEPGRSVNVNVLEYTVSLIATLDPSSILRETTRGPNTQ